MASVPVSAFTCLFDSLVFAFLLALACLLLYSMASVCAGVRIRTGIGLFVIVLNGVGAGAGIRMFIRLAGICVPTGIGLFTVELEGVSAGADVRRVCSTCWCQAVCCHRCVHMWLVLMSISISTNVK